jgi:hypothetical protein
LVRSFQLPASGFQPEDTCRVGSWVLAEKPSLAAGSWQLEAETESKRI